MRRPASLLDKLTLHVPRFIAPPLRRLLIYLFDEAGLLPAHKNQSATWNILDMLEQQAHGFTSLVHFLDDTTHVTDVVATALS